MSQKIDKCAHCGEEYKRHTPHEDFCSIMCIIDAYIERRREMMEKFRPRLTFRYSDKDEDKE
jgi:hypothetical protein